MVLLEALHLATTLRPGEAEFSLDAGVLAHFADDPALVSEPWVPPSAR